MTLHSLKTLAIDGLEDIYLLLLSLRILREWRQRSHVGETVQDFTRYEDFVGVHES